MAFDDAWWLLALPKILIIALGDYFITDESL